MCGEVCGRGGVEVKWMDRVGVVRCVLDEVLLCELLGFVWSRVYV